MSATFIDVILIASALLNSLFSSASPAMERVDESNIPVPIKQEDITKINHSSSLFDEIILRQACTNGESELTL